VFRFIDLWTSHHGRPRRACRVQILSGPFLKEFGARRKSLRNVKSFSGLGFTISLNLRFDCGSIKYEGRESSVEKCRHRQMIPSGCKLVRVRPCGETTSASM
jgi:hypothetical protein